MMARTTLDLDPAVLRALKRRQREEQKTLGQIASELLARALADDRPPDEATPLRWSTTSMGLKVDLEDKEELWRLLDSE